MDIVAVQTVLQTNIISGIPTSSKPPEYEEHEPRMMLKHKEEIIYSAPNDHQHAPIQYPNPGQYRDTLSHTPGKI